MPPAVGRREPADTGAPASAGGESVRTMPYPGFPTDAQAPMMAMTTVSDGISIFVENIFESRYKHVGELCRLGANIKVEAVWPLWKVCQGCSERLWKRRTCGAGQR